MLVTLLNLKFALPYPPGVANFRFGSLEGNDMSEAARQRVAIVTGSARGLGKAIAGALARQGVALMLVDILAGPLRSQTHKQDSQSV